MIALIISWYVIGLVNNTGMFIEHHRHHKQSYTVGAYYALFALLGAVLGLIPLLVWWLDSVIPWPTVWEIGYEEPDIKQYFDQAEQYLADVMGSKYK